MRFQNHHHPINLNILINLASKNLIVASNLNLYKKKR